MRNDNLIPFDEVTGHHFFLLISTVRKKKIIAVLLFPLVKSHKKSKLTASKIKKKEKKSKPYIKAIGRFEDQLKRLGKRAKVLIQQGLPL